MRNEKGYRITDIKEPWTAAAIHRITHRENGYGIDDGYVPDLQPSNEVLTQETNRVTTMTRKADRPKEYIYKSTLRTEYGLTPSMIEELGEPDLWVDNPHYQCAPDASLYRIDRVEAWVAANQERVEKAKEIRPRRSSSAKVAHEKKRVERLRQEAEKRAAEQRQMEEWRKLAAAWLDGRPITCAPLPPTLIEDAQQQFKFRADRPYWEQAALRSYVRYELTNFKELKKEARRLECEPVLHDMLRQRVDEVAAKAIMEWKPPVPEARTDRSN